jgi:hypothetical protein
MGQKPGFPSRGIPTFQQELKAAEVGAEFSTTIRKLCRLMGKPPGLIGYKLKTLGFGIAAWMASSTGTPDRGGTSSGKERSLQRPGDKTKEKNERTIRETRVTA